MDQKVYQQTDSKYAARKFINEYAYGFASTINFTYKAVKIEDSNEFKQVIENQNLEEIEKLENAIIYMHQASSNKNDIDWTKKFYQKYVKYLENKLNDDIFEYINNKFCLYLIFNDGICHGTEKYNKVVFERKVSEIFEILDNSYDDILKKIDKGIELNNKEKKFMENYFFAFTSNSYSLPTSDIFKYFQRYPLQNLDSFKNKKLFLLYSLSKKVKELGMECSVHFDEKDVVEKNSSGYFTILDDETLLININDVSSYEIKDDLVYFFKLFTIYHEIGHLNQETNLEKFSPEIKQLFTMENKIINENNNFYQKYHNHFFKEKNADEFAIEELQKDFRDNKIVAAICETKKEKLLELYKSNDDYKEILFEQYNKLKSDTSVDEINFKKR